MTQRLWICPNCGSITTDYNNLDICLACETEVDECDKQYLPDEEQCLEYPEDVGDIY